MTTSDLGKVGLSDLSTQMQEAYGDKAYMVAHSALAEPTNVVAALQSSMPAEEFAKLGFDSNPSSAEVARVLANNPQLASNEGLNNFMSSHYNEAQQFSWSEGAQPVHTSTHQAATETVTPTTTETVTPGTTDTTNQNAAAAAVAATTKEGTNVAAAAATATKEGTSATAEVTSADGSTVTATATTATTATLNGKANEGTTPTNTTEATPNQGQATEGTPNGKANEGTTKTTENSGTTINVEKGAKVTINLTQNANVDNSQVSVASATTTGATHQPQAAIPVAAPSVSAAELLNQPEAQITNPPYGTMEWLEANGLRYDPYLSGELNHTGEGHKASQYGYWAAAVDANGKVHILPNNPNVDQEMIHNSVQDAWREAKYDHHEFGCRHPKGLTTENAAYYRPQPYYGTGTTVPYEGSYEYGMKAHRILGVASHSIEVGSQFLNLVEKTCEVIGGHKNHHNHGSSRPSNYQPGARHR